MRRLYVVAEGPTEQAFAKAVLAPHLLSLQLDTRVITVTTKRDPLTQQKLAQGGGRWSHWKRDIERVVFDDTDPTSRVTTLFDLYGLPKDYPGRQAHWKVADTVKRAKLLEDEMANAVNDPRLIPYIQRHEFEALVLAGLESLEALLDAPDALEAVAQLRAQIAGQAPEDVNDGPLTAPSKRLLKIPGYQKPLHGELVTMDTGLEKLRTACPRFGEWLSTLEKLGA